METLLHQIAAHNLQNRTVAFLENGSWAPVSVKHMTCLLYTSGGSAVFGTQHLGVCSRHRALPASGCASGAEAAGQ